ncbi:AAA family ATPase [Parasphingopyxis sp.]|uniref:chloramphenicol phosphotransferase CPT family protein n=1 Tax=Parasphingopyxis sp. TaxID=1920299 RepID=UPI002629A2B1|nr:AAA family ATPase [Parasphingopyxis sp.]
MDSQPKIIILNGVSSVGKSTLARAVQNASRLPFLHVSLDAFLAMIPARLFDHPDGIAFRTLEADGPPVTEVTTGPIVDRMLRGIPSAVAALAAAGNNIIVDEVFFRGGERQGYADAFADFDVVFVGLFAPLDVVEARERARGDRDIGLARWQYDRVHAGQTYDLEIDTGEASAAEAARTLCECLNIT